jgi:hypothetical protein
MDLMIDDFFTFFAGGSDTTARSLGRPHFFFFIKFFFLLA